MKDNDVLLLSKIHFTNRRLMYSKEYTLYNNMTEKRTKEKCFTYKEGRLRDHEKQSPASQLYDGQGH